jgi:hypothetical protein
VKLPAWLIGRPHMGDSGLIGCWQRVEPSVEGELAAEMQFRDRGQLRYCVLTRDSWQIMKLTYSVEGGALITDQPSAPREERTRFLFEQDGTLVLEYQGLRSKFRKGDCLAPDV